MSHVGVPLNAETRCFTATKHISINALVATAALTHKKRSWMTENYHKRIQKKWNKRARENPVYVKPVQQVSLKQSLVDKITEAITRSMTMKEQT
jgi:hypothetical protein